MIRVEKKVSIQSLKPNVFAQTVLYPNPASQTIHLAAQIADHDKNPLQITIRDYMGRTITTQPISSAKNISATLSIGDLHQGWYVIELKGGTQKWSGSFLKF
mgnify:FL=1